MERRRAVASILGLGLCLALLGWWALRPDPAVAPAAPANPTAHRSQPSLAAEPAQVIQPVADSTDAADTSAKTAPSLETFRGRLVDAVTRQPVREFELHFHPLRFNNPREREPVHRSFRTKDGRFQCGCAPAGLWTVFATAAGYQRFELPEVQLVAAKVSEELLIPMRPGVAVRGRVFNQATGAPVAAATLQFREAHVGRYQGNFRMRPSVRSQQDGSFLLDGLPTGSVIVTAHAERYAARELTVTTGNKMAPLEIGLSTGGSIAGYLAGSDGITAVSGQVTLSYFDQNGGTATQLESSSEFVFERLPAGRYRLTGRSGALSGGRYITLADDERVEGIVLALSSGLAIRGTVTGLRPEEFKEVTVFVYPLKGYGDFSQDVRVDERGRFVVNGVPPGSMSINVNVGMSRQMTKQVEMPADRDLTVTLEFPTGSRLSGQVTRGGKPLADVMLRANAMTPNNDGSFIYPVQTSDSGEYAIDGLPAGEYIVSVGAYRSQTVRIAGDTQFDVEVPPTQLSGRLLEDGGKLPVVGANVSIWPTQPNTEYARASSRSDHFGQFNFAGLEPGEFMLSVYKPGYELYRQPVSYSPPASAVNVPMRPARGV
ncbi:carboxypeptidase-like regulatory domain-containing protein, partial [Steroidobacter sp.]|uniref:carboxypeptidase-like regulatory domain-containing protein n=1 Tax=Steroidobacter sp. TaxID=1978227 RepID=UPI001A4EAF6F